MNEEQQGSLKGTSSPLESVAAETGTGSEAAGGGAASGACLRDGRPAGAVAHACSHSAVSCPVSLANSGFAVALGISILTIAAAMVNFRRTNR